MNDSEQNTGGAKINIGTVKSYTEDTDSSNDNRVNNFNPIDKITELYERLLKEKDEKYAALPFFFFRCQQTALTTPKYTLLYHHEIRKESQYDETNTLRNN